MNLGYSRDLINESSNTLSVPHRHGWGKQGFAFGTKSYWSVSNSVCVQSPLVFSAAQVRSERLGKCVVVPGGSHRISQRPGALPSLSFAAFPLENLLLLFLTTLTPLNSHRSCVCLCVCLCLCVCVCLCVSSMVTNRVRPPDLKLCQCSMGPGPDQWDIMPRFPRQGCQTQSSWQPPWSSTGGGYVERLVKSKSDSHSSCLPLSSLCYLAVQALCPPYPSHMIVPLPTEYTSVVVIK